MAELTETGRMAVPRPQPRMESRSVRLPADPGPLEVTTPGPAWLRRGEGLVAEGEALRLHLPVGSGSIRAAAAAFTDLLADAEIDDGVGEPGSGPVAFLHAPFDPGSRSVVVVPDALTVRRGGGAWSTRITVGGAAGQTAAARPATGHSSVRWLDETDAQERWDNDVRAILDEVARDRVRKVVLSRERRGRADRPVDTASLVRVLARQNPGSYTFSCARMVGASPELLVRRLGMSVESLVLAGSMVRADPAHPADANSRALWESPKNRAEHAISVESFVEALRPYCASLSVPAEPSVLGFGPVQHLATRVRGVLAAPLPITDLVAAVHPTAAVCGSPYNRASATIRRLEDDRGLYAGPVGWTDVRGNGEFAIALRCVHVLGRELVMRAGAGIVAGSDPAAEWEETQAKFRTVERALAMAAEGRPR